MVGMKFDIELTERDVQQLATANEVVAFFARLGYNTRARLVQAPENLGITADGAGRPIRRIELIADQDKLLQVHLFELSSVTVTHTRARTFRNRAGNYLLVLTSDYERLVRPEDSLTSTGSTSMGRIGKEPMTGCKHRWQNGLGASCLKCVRRQQRRLSF